MIMSMPQVRRMLLIAAIFAGALQTPTFGADGSNPKPCKDPWECYEKPSISGSASGSSSICRNKSGTWSVSETATPGKKTRCDEEKEVGVSPIAWGWEVQGPETASGYGNSFSRSFATTGSYKVIFTGRATSQDSVCDHPDQATAEYSFTVNGPSPSYVLGESFATESATICPSGNSIAKTFVIDTTSCFESPYTVRWRVESISGDPEVTFVPSSGTVIVEQQADTVEIRLIVQVAAGSPSGVETIRLTTTTDFDEQTADTTFEVPAPQASASIESQIGCPAGIVSIPFAVTNTGSCTTLFNWTISTATTGVAVVGQGNPPIEIAAGATHNDIAEFEITPGVFSGEEFNYEIVVRAGDQDNLARATGRYRIGPQPKVEVKEARIIAGGRNESTESTEVELSMNCQASSDTVTVSLTGGLGSTAAESYVYVVGVSQWQVGGNQPAVLTSGFSSISGGSNATISVNISSGQKIKLRLFSSNKVGDSATIRAQGSNGSSASATVTFTAPSYNLSFKNPSDEFIDAQEIPGGQNLIAVCKLGTDDKPIVGHRVAFYCERFTTSYGQVITINSDSDPNISGSELARMNQFVWFDRDQQGFITNDNGEVKFDFVIMTPGITDIKFQVRDLDVFNPNGP